ncbi:MAG: peptide/nickel transport system permease protein [Actinomycetota bacterium]|nr:peptide/nickel transport system permease protein [Actinomycetota bacterium]
MRLGARIGRLAAGLLAVALVLFALPARLPGGTEDGLLGSHAGDPIARARLRTELDLDRSLPVRFVHFVVEAVHGNLGHSPVSGVDVGAVVGERVPESLAFAAAAAAFAFVATRRRRRRSGDERARDDAPAPSAVPGAVWVLPLFAAVAVAVRFGAVPAPAPHAAIVSRCEASLLPAAALGIALAVWASFARRTRRDLLAAVLIGTLVTEVVFGLPGLGTLLLDAATRSDPMMVRGVLLVVAAIAVVAGVTSAPLGRQARHVTGGPPRQRGDLTGGPSNRRRAAGGTLATLWIVALVAATVGRLDLGLAPASRIENVARAGTRVGEGISATHPFGTDALGRDVLARVLATARGSLLLVVAAMLVATAVGTGVGLLVAFAGGRGERLGLTALSGWTAFPGELTAVALLAFNGRSGTRAAFALALVAAPAVAFGVQRRALDGLRGSDSQLPTGAWLGSVGSGAMSGYLRPTLATMFVSAARVIVAELVAGLLGFGPAATQTWSHEVVLQLSFASRAPLAVIAPVSVAVITAVALAGIGNAIRPARA